MLCYNNIQYVMLCYNNTTQHNMLYNICYVMLYYINKLFQLAVFFLINALCRAPDRKHTKGNGQNSGDREALRSRDKGTRREALQGGDKIEWYRG